MRKHIFLIALLTAALGAGSATFAAGPDAGAGKGSGPVSQGTESQNAQYLEDATRGQDRAEERRGQKSKPQLKEQERQRVQDGSGPMHENRTMTQEQKQPKPQIQQKAKPQPKPSGKPDEPLQLQEQIQEQSQQQLRINK